MALEFSGNVANECWIDKGGCDDLVSSLGGMAANAGGNRRSVSSAVCHWHFPSRIQAQYKRIQARTFTAPAKDMASADNVLTTTFCIFLECHMIGLTAMF